MEHFFIDRFCRIDPLDGLNTTGVQPEKSLSPILYYRRHVPHSGFAERLTSILSPVPRPGKPIGSAATKPCCHRQYFLPDVAHTNRGKAPFSCQQISDPALPFRMIGNAHSRQSPAMMHCPAACRQAPHGHFPPPLCSRFPLYPESRSSSRILIASPVAGPATTARLQAAFRTLRLPQSICLYFDGHPAPSLPRMVIRVPENTHSDRSAPYPSPIPIACMKNPSTTSPSGIA